MRLKIFIASLLFGAVAHAQITDPIVLRNYINATIVPNNTRNVTAQQLNSIFNGTLNVMGTADIDSFATSRTFDTLYIYQHNAAGQQVRKGYHIGGNFDTTSLNNRINALNTAKINLSDSTIKYVTPSQLAVVSGGSVYHSGDNIVQFSGSAVTVDTITILLSKANAANTYTPKGRKVNGKALSADITLNKGDFNDLNVVDNTSDMTKPLSNPQADSLAKKVNKTTTINSKALTSNVVLDKSDIGLGFANNTADVDKPVSNPTKDSLTASTFEKSLVRGNTTSQDDSIDATGHRFAIAADQFAIKGKGIVTKFGVISRVGSETGAAATTLGFPVARSSYTYGSSAYPFETIANAYPSLEVHVVINSTTIDGTQNFLDSASVPAYLASLSSVWDTHISGHNIHYFAPDNEPTTSSYRMLTPASMRRSAFATKSFVGLAKRKDPACFTSDGGVVTGVEGQWLVYHWLDSTGQAAAALAFKNATFTASQISAGVDNWGTTGAHAVTIARMRELLGYEKSMDSLDAISVHLTEAVTDVATFDTTVVAQNIKYFSLLTGKQVVFNELGVNNQSPTLVTQMMNTMVANNVRYAIFYNNTDTTFTGNDNALTANNGNTLRTNGAAGNANFTRLINLSKDIVNTANGQFALPQEAQSVPVPAYIYPGGRVGAGSNKGTTDTTGLLDSVRAQLTTQQTLISGKANTTDLSVKADKTTTINNKPLNSNVTLQQADIPALPDSLLKKVDRKTGFDLSSNDYTSTDKSTVALVPAKEDKFSKVPFTTVIKLNGRTMSDPYQQTAKLVFSADSFALGGQYIQTIKTTTDSLVWDTSLFVIEKDYYPQQNKTNDFVYQRWSDGKIHVNISTRNRNIPNLIYSYTNQVVFATPDGYEWLWLTVNNNTADYVNVYAGTTLGGNDLISNRYLPPGESLIQTYTKFNTSAIVFLTIPSGADWSVNDTKYNQ